jgi:APA family basic amino acid/polyamine antiporter
MTSYARRLGLFSGTMAVVGGIIGSGIFRNPAVVAQRVGTAQLTLGVWVLGAAVALCGALCFAELGARKPRAGGGYVYLRDALGPLWGFLYGWALVLIISTGAIAGTAMTFASYANTFLRLPASAAKPLALSAIVALSAVNYVGIRPGAIAQNVLTVLKLSGLALLIGIGLFAALPVEPAAPIHTVAAPSGSFAIAIAIGSALVPVLFSYGGFQQTNYIAEELIDAERNLPRALTLGVLLVVVVYLSANFVYLRALGPHALALSEAPAADVMRLYLGELGGRIIALAITCSTFGALGLVIMVTPRVYQAMAADGLFVPGLAALHPVYRTPGRAIVVQGVWSMVLALSGSYAQLVDYVTFGDWIFFALTAATLFVYRARERREGADARGFRMIGYPWVPALFITGAAYVVVSSIVANPRNACIGVLLIAAGVPAYFYAKKAHAKTLAPGLEGPL